MALIEIRNLEKVYKSGKIEFQALKGIDLSALAAGAEMWGMSRMIFPVIAAQDVFVANGMVLILGLVVSAYPAVKAARFTPVEAMMHN